MQVLKCTSVATLSCAVYKPLAIPFPRYIYHHNLRGLVASWNDLTYDVQKPNFAQYYIQLCIALR